MPRFEDILAQEIDQRRAASAPAAPYSASLTANDWLVSARLHAGVAVEQADRKAAAKQRFRARALATHPDRGGSADAFMAAVRDYELEVALAS